MTEITQVARNELTTAEVLEILERGGRVLIEVSVLGTSTRVVIRQQNGIYYCDTPMKLFKHDTPEELKDCLERFRLSKPVSPIETDRINATS